MVRRGVGGVLVGLNGENQQVRPVRETASPPLQRGTPLGRGSRLKEDGRWYAVVAAPPRPVDDVVDVVCLELVRDMNVLGLGRGGRGRGRGGAGDLRPRQLQRPATLLCRPRGGAATRRGRPERTQGSALVR